MSFFSKFFGAKGAVAGLDLGSNTLKIAQLTKTPAGLQLTKLASAPTPPLSIKDSAIVDARLLGESVKALAVNNKLNVSKVVGAVAGQSVVIRPITMTQMTEREMQAAIRFEAEKYLPYSVAEAQIIGSILRKSIDGDEKSMEVLLVAAPNEMVKNTEEVVKMSGLGLEAIDLEPFALLRALQNMVDAETFKQTIALINLGAASSSINIFKEGMLRHNRTISVAGNSFTRAIGQSLNLSFEEAEKIKKEKGVIRVEKDATPVAPTTMRIFNVIVPVLTELTTEVQRSFEYYRSRYRGESVDLVILSGGTAKFKNIDQYLSGELGVACQLANPFKNISVENVAGMAKDVLQDQAPAFAVVTGLALRSVG